VRDKELHPIRRETDDKGPHAEGERILKTREPTPGEGGSWLGRSGPRPASQAHFGAQSAPFDLDAIRAIDSPEAKSHTSINSSSAAEERRREGHHLKEERVELVE
jgi:hypothetical protein